MNGPLPSTPAVFLPGITVFTGDALRVLRSLPENSVDAVVCDPPYAIRAVPDPGEQRRSTSAVSVCALCSVLLPKPGYEVCASCLEELRISAFAEADMLGQQSANWHEKATHSRGYADNSNTAFGLWVSLWARACLRVLKPGGHLVAFGGTRTWHRLACAVEDVGFEVRDSLAWLYASGVPKGLNVGRAVQQTSAATDTNLTLPGAGGGRAGPNTSLAPDDARDGNAARSWDGWYTGVKPAHEPIVLARKPVVGTVAGNVLAFGTGALNVAGTYLDGGKWPTNVFLDDEQATQVGALDGRGSRAFFVAKPGRGERVVVGGVAHPTVKPLALMRELVRLVTPAAGLVLDPFAGSGTTVEACVLEGRHCVAIERDGAYMPLIEARLDRTRLGDEQRVGRREPVGRDSDAVSEPEGTLF